MKINAVLIRLLMLTITMSMVANKAYPQELQFGLYAEPLISWFSSDTEASENNGARPGIAFGLTFDKYFARNYAFSSGISIINASGRLTYADTLSLRLKNSTLELNAGDKISYRIQYLAVPLGIRMKTNRIGYTTFFANVGMCPKIVIGGKASIPSLDIEKENISKELRLFNLGYGITVGVEYSLGGKSAIILGIAYEDNFLDVTRDYSGQPMDRIGHHMIRFRTGLNF
ncbi:MAG: PorT family protein [Bacteroidales bacterium]|nr:PorT family protein [Bacteroidales bacterium]